MLELSFNWEIFVKAFLAIFVIMDTLGNVPIFMVFTDKYSPKHRLQSANEAFYVATLILLLFLFFGMGILNLFNISLNDFKIGGGILILLIGLKICLGIHLKEERAKSYDIAIVPMATPLIVGPGTITTTIILVQQYGYFIPLLAALANLLFTWFALRNTELLFRIFGKQGSDAISRLMGLIILAIGVSFITSGWLG
jgi:multiple antibiotic resistance protein